MPELPDVVVYLERIAARVAGKTLDAVRLRTPFVLRTFDPPMSSVSGRVVRGVRRVGKRLVLVLDAPDAPGRTDDPLFLVVHLMVAGRLRWSDSPRAPIPGKVGLAAFDFPDGCVIVSVTPPSESAAAAS